MRWLAALRFLTIMPLPGRQASPEEVGGSTAYFPLVGIIIGLILAGLNWFFSLLLPSAVVNGLLIVSMVVINGALHLDGFIDTCDGMAGHKTAAARWRVMRDSRVGAYGIAGAFCLLLVKYLALNSVPPSLLLATLVLLPVVSRWAMVYTVFGYPYARPSGLGKAFKQGTGWLQFAMATIMAAAVAWVLFRLAGLVMLAGIWVIAVVWAAYFKRKFSGLTGDSYGAINELAEVGFLLFVSLLAYKGWLGLA
ncbi:MAG: adenosylcobinamide-GDP ribazoletransferase [Dehalococcoidales bacterium]